MIFIDTNCLIIDSSLIIQSAYRIKTTSVLHNLIASVYALENPKFLALKTDKIAVRRGRKFLALQADQIADFAPQAKILST